MAAGADAPQTAPSPSLSPSSAAPSPSASAASLTRGLERSLDEAVSSGLLNLSNRRLREFPREAANCDLTDVTQADLSRNRLTEIPDEICQFISLERLNLYHNCLRSLNPSLSNLQALWHLNLSRGQLTVLPMALCSLPLKVLIISNNRLTELPAAIGHLRCLRELDVSCNELQSLPPELGNLESLRELSVRRNQLNRLPEELAELPLCRLDFSCNRISRIPVCYRHLRHLQTIRLDNNPLLSPPAQICTKGKIHIFKYLNIEACKMVSEIGDLERNPAGWPPDEVPPRRGTGGLDSGFHSVDSGSKRWSVNESVDELMDRMEDVTRDSRQQRVGSGESAGKPAHPNPEPGDCVQGGTEEGERGKIPPTNEEDSGTEKPGSQPHLIAERNTRWSGDGPRRETEERRKPGTLLIWQERERQLRSQGERRVLSSNPASRPVSCSFPEPGGKTPASELVPTGVVSIPRHKIDDVQVVGVSRLPAKRPDQPLVSPTREPGNVQRPQSFLFRTSTRPNLKRSGSGSSSPLSPTFPSDPMNPNGIGTPEPETLSVSQLRQELESRLRRRFPDDLGEALTDGVALCQLLNLLRPRSISVIYVPSPAVPKLTLSKRRKNVESFLDGCQRIGVPQDAMCEARQILEDESLVRVCRMVGALLDITRGKASKPPTQG